MKKFFVNIVCAFIPNDAVRRRTRKRLVGLRPADIVTAAITDNACRITQQMDALQHSLNDLRDRPQSAPVCCAPDVRPWVNRIIEKKLSTAFMHQKTFLPFKAIHSGQDIVIVATGPSLNDFQPIKNAVYIGVNNAFLYKKLKLDYIFAQDYEAVSKHIDLLDKYRSGKCIKFYGLTTEFGDGFRRVIPESHAIAACAHRYRTDWEDINGFSPDFAYDISTQSLGCFGSIVFPAIQFALWTNPRRIYLVGCDCNNLGHFDNSSSEDLSRLIQPWRKLKDFVSVYYPVTEIISVNPVGLKGMFADLYQKRSCANE